MSGGRPRSSRSQIFAFPQPDRGSVLNRARCKINQTSNLSLPFLSYLLHRHATATMGVSWKTPDQKVFIEEHHASYSQHSMDGSLKTMFWPDFLDKWFERWPVPEPPSDVEGGVQLAKQSERKKKISVSIIRSADQSTQTHHSHSN